MAPVGPPDAALRVWSHLELTTGTPVTILQDHNPPKLKVLSEKRQVQCKEKHTQPIKALTFYILLGAMKPELRETWTPAINVLTWFMLVTAILSVFTRLGTKYWIFRKLTVDDGLSIGSLVTCVGQSIAVSMATEGGLGQHFVPLAVSDVENMMKSQYAANILFVASMCCSKLALMMFIRNLTPASLDRWFALGLGIFITMWAVTGIFTASFQCQVPATWDYLYGECFDLVVWWNYLGVTNIVSEAGIIVQALLVIIRVQANIHKKVVLASVFLFRVVVTIAIICQLAYAEEAKGSGDPTWDTWTVTISTQMTQSLSIITACSPQFKPFLDSLRSSGMSLGGTSYGSQQRTYAGTSYKISRGQRTGETPSETHELVTMPEEAVNRTFVTSSPDCDAESQTSQSQIIREIRTWTVTETQRV
ncbi:uncharacterized protein N7482_006959 [Penicillium canariense]|uniref:Rhodopsin domain-containing protein n=1 Tax=Penicillium canariense TaxID=189055 RepID=A0A9W9I0Q6_9EURO|nr:uncharacterized protein N7482_006959 [Penicillium canariense]KAJ5159955.1 hypothetical protein N7482_006959 [Penicillium canariense]